MMTPLKQFFDHKRRVFEPCSNHRFEVPAGVLAIGNGPNRQLVQKAYRRLQC
jgi:hypothetical protein